MGGEGKGQRWVGGDKEEGWVSRDMGEGGEEG